MRASWLLALVLVLTTIGCDRASKHLATEKLAHEPAQSYFADTVRFEYAENSGAFLGVGSGLPEWVRFAVFRIGVTAALAAIVFVAIKQRWGGVMLAGPALVFAGGVSNLIDRLARGHVVDFVSIGIGSVRTGIFNVADVAIMAGAALIALGTLITNDRTRIQR